MNNSAYVKRVEVALEESRFVETLVEGFSREPQGLKTNTDMVRLLIIGLVLSIKELRSATITDAYRALIKCLDYRDQLRLGFKTGPEPKDYIDRDRLYYAAELLVTKLAYGVAVRGVLDDEEIERRFETLFTAGNDLLDYVASATPYSDHVLALDATAVWSWSRGKWYPKPTEAEIAAQTDELIKQRLIELTTDSGDKSDLEGAKLTDDPAKLQGLDPDAAWSGATAKNGGTKRFYGYYAHTLVSVPSWRIKDNIAAEVPLIRRVVVVTSTGDIVQPSLRMLDSLLGLSTKPRNPNLLLVDRHYSYKKFEDWQSELIPRNIRQGLDLRSDDYKVIYFKDTIHFAGDVYCRWAEPEIFEKRRPGVFATNEEHEEYQAHRDMAKTRTMVRINSMDENGDIKLRCPARQYKVACPLFPPSMLVAAERGLDIINPQFADMSPENLPECCAQDTFRMTIPEQAAKLNQHDVFGTTEWYKNYNRRTYVEGSYGNLKNPHTENLRRGTIQKTGIVWNQLVITLMAFVYNERLIRDRHTRIGGVFEGHPLLTPDSESNSHVSLTATQERELFNDFVAGISLDDLEIHASDHVARMTVVEEGQEHQTQAKGAFAQLMKVWNAGQQSSSTTGGAGRVHVL